MGADEVGSAGASKAVAEGDLIQVNEAGPSHWFRVILVVDEVKSWGVQAYCTIPGAQGHGVGDAYRRLEWKEFDPLGAKSLFIAELSVAPLVKPAEHWRMRAEEVRSTVEDAWRAETKAAMLRIAEDYDRLAGVADQVIVSAHCLRRADAAIARLARSYGDFVDTMSRRAWRDEAQL